MDETKENIYEEPVLLGTGDLEEVAGGCLFVCSLGSCRPPKEKEEV